MTDRPEAVLLSNLFLSLQPTWCLKNLAGGVLFVGRIPVRQPSHHHHLTFDEGAHPVHATDGRLDQDGSRDTSGDTRGTRGAHVNFRNANR